MSCNLVGASESGLPSGPLGTALAGTLVSSLHRLKDSSNVDGAFFVFGDLSIKLEGTFRLQFNLYEMRDKECFHIQSTQSDPFVSHPQKTFPGMSESTFLTRSFSDQGVRLRLRKEPRTLLKKRGPASDDYQPRQYNPRPPNTSTRPPQNRTQSFAQERQEEQNTSRQPHVEPIETTQLPIHQQVHAQPATYDTRSIGAARPYVHSHQSQQSSVSITGSFSDEGPNKRPRTGSEHSSTYSQQLSPQDAYPPRNFDQSFPNSFASPTGTYNNSGNFTFVSPPPSGISSREQYFSQRINTQTGGHSPSFDQSSHRSPQSAHFPQAPQIHPLRYQQSLPHMGGHIGNSPTQRSPYDAYGPRTQITPALGQLTMAPPQYGRMNTSPTTYSPTGSSMGAMGRAREYEYPLQQLNVSTASLVGSLMSSSAPHDTSISAPGELERLEQSQAF
jgi:hypothetical protein